MKSAVCKPSLWLNTWMTILSSGNIVLRLSTFFYVVSIIQGPLSNLLRKHVNGHLPFLDVLVVKKECSLTITVHRKPTHTGRYLSYNSNQPICVKWGVIQGLGHRANKLCHNEQDNWTAGFIEEGNLWIQLLAKKPRYRKNDDNNAKMCV